MGMDERKHEPPPPVIGEEIIDITSLLWKDEDKDMVHVDQRYLVGIYVIKQKLTVLRENTTYNLQIITSY